MSTYQQLYQRFIQAIEGTPLLPYNTLKRSVAAAARQHGQKLADFKRVTLQKFVYDNAMRQFREGMQTIEQSRKRSMAFNAARSSFAEKFNQIKRAPDATIQELRAQREAINRTKQYAEDEFLASLVDVNAIFARHTSPINVAGDSITINVDVNAIYSEVFGIGYRHPENPPGVNELVRFGNNEFKEWFIRNRLNQINIPANKNLFLLRRDFDPDLTTTVLWTSWRRPNGEFVTYADMVRKFHWLGAPGYGMVVVFDNRYTLEMRLVDIKNNANFVRVGYNVLMPVGEKNCFIKIISPYVHDTQRAFFEEETKSLVHKEDGPAFISSEDINRLGIKYRFKATLFTPYGAAISKSAQVLGAGGNKKNFKIVVQDSHARIFAPTNVNAVEYINDLTEYNRLAASPDFVNEIEGNSFTDTSIEGSIFQYAQSSPYTLKTIAGFVTTHHRHNNVDRRQNIDINQRPRDAINGRFTTEAQTTMYKFLRPSAITNNPDDDTNPKLFAKVNPAAVFMFDFIRKHDIITPPMFVQEIASVAGRPFGTTHFAIAKDRTEKIEIDQNASYASFDASPFYEGFPMGNWMKIAGAPKDQPDAEIKPAFVEIAFISLKKDATAYETDYYDALFRLRKDFTYITYPEYKRWSQMFNIACVNTIYASFKRINLTEDLKHLEDRIRATCPQTDTKVDAANAYVKLMRNSFTGKLIQGGLDVYNIPRTFTTLDRDEFEIMVGEVEQQTGELPRCEITRDQTTGREIFKIHTTINKRGNRYPHLYAYITAISRLSVLEKIAQIKALNVTLGKLDKHKLKLLHVHVDAIYVRAPRCIRRDTLITHLKSILPDIGTNAGQFKVGPGRPGKFLNVTPINEPIYSAGQPTAEGYPAYRKVVVIGPGGVGKSTVAVNAMPTEKDGRALYLTPTKELRAGLRDKLAHNNKDPYDCICLESVRKAIGSVAPKHIELINKIDAVYSHVIIDEYCKSDGAHVEAIVKYLESRRKNIIMMGDYNQTTFSLSRVFIDREKLNEMGFYLFADPRNARSPDKPMRHSYEWGTFLDSIAEMSPNEQVARLINYGIRTVNDAAELDPTAIMYCGNWTAIANYNGRLLDNDTVPRLRSIRSGEIIPYNPALKPVVWNKNTFAGNPPRGKKYTINYAITVDCVQGSTVENPIQYIHVSSLLNRRGAIYTAVTRSRTPEQIILII